MLDGLGWEQLQEHRDLLPTLTAMEGGPITTVAPTTTATALSSIATGLTPAEHGLLGYRMLLGGEVINVLRWTSTIGDRRRAHPPHDVQPFAAFLGHQVPVISPAELQGTAFTEGHLRGSRPVGYRATSAIAVEVGRQLRGGERFVYAYYGLVDKTAHERGFGEYYDAELRTADRLVGDVLDALHAGRRAPRDRRPRPGRRRRPHRPADPRPPRPRRHAVGGGPLPLVARPPRRRRRAGQGGHRALRGRRLDRHPRSGHRRALVRARPSPRRSPPASATWRSSRSPRSASSTRPTPGPFELICRHGSLTPAEVLVPLLAGRR